MSGETRTQKTEIWFADTTLKKILNVADLGEFGAMADDIDTTNLDSLAKEFLTGLGDNGELTLQINLNPQDLVHQKLMSEAGSGNRFSFCVGLSDGVTPPTVVANACVAPAAAGRSSYIFLASVKSFKQAFKTNDVTRVNCALRISGAVVPTWHT